LFLLILLFRIIADYDGLFLLVNQYKHFRRWMIGYLMRWRTQGVAQCSTTCRSSRHAAFLNVDDASWPCHRQVFFKVLYFVIIQNCVHLCNCSWDVVAGALFRVFMMIHALLWKE